jgi:hypothetical protein
MGSWEESDPMATVNVFDPGDRVIEVKAYGGTRRERGSAIGAAVRGRGWTLTSVHYSETYGFQSATYARYRRRV